MTASRDGGVPPKPIMADPPGASAGIMRASAAETTAALAPPPRQLCPRMRPGAPLQEIMLKRCWILLSPMSQPSSPDLPIGGAEGAARLEVRDGKAVILLSQDIPESAGYVHKAFGLEV
jgi:hypothetical protein